MRHFLILVGFLFCACVDAQVSDDEAWRIMQTRDLRKVESLLAKIPVNHQLPKGGTLLAQAAAIPWPDCVDYLLKHGANPNQKAAYGKTPLMFAAERGSLEAARKLLDAGAKPNEKDDGGSAAIHYCVNWSHGCLVIGGLEDNQGAVVKLLAERGADINAKDRNGLTPLMWAAGWSHPPSLEALIKLGADLEARDSGGRTALTWCASGGRDFSAARALLKAGAQESVMDALIFGDREKAEELYNESTPLTLKGTNGEDLLMRAAEIGSLDLVQKLLARGASVRAEDHQGVSCLFYATGVRRADSIGLTRYNSPTQTGPRHAIVTALIRAGADPDARVSKKDTSFTSGQTPLYWSILGASPDAASALLAAGADPNLEVDEAPPLDHAIGRRVQSTIEALLRAGADPKRGTPLQSLFDPTYPGLLASNGAAWETQMTKRLLELGAGVSARDGYGQGALDLAALRGNLDAVKILLGAGAKIDGRDKGGATALMKAANYGHLAVVELLLEKGADKSLKDQEGRTALYFARSENHTAVIQVLQDE